jgi:hypothetical protein
VARATLKVKIFQNKEIIDEIQNKIKEKIPKNESESVEEEWKILKKKIQPQETQVEHQGNDTKKCHGRMTKWQK